MKLQVSTADLLPILGVVARLMVDDAFRARVKTTGEAARALLAELGPDLPRKADGTPWTTGELEAVCQTIEGRANAIKARMGGGAQP